MRPDPKTRLVQIIKENSGSIKKTEELLHSFLNQLNQKDDTKEMETDFVLDMLVLLKPDKYSDR